MTTVALEVRLAIHNALSNPEGFVRILASQAIRDLRLPSLLDALVEIRVAEGFITVNDLRAASGAR